VSAKEERPLATLPDGIVFPADYRISESAVYKAYHKAMDQEPEVNAEVYRKEDTARCEDMFMHLQRGISAGDPRSVDAGVRVLAHKAKLNGYTVEPEQVNGAGGFQVNIHLIVGARMTDGHSLIEDVNSAHGRVKVESK
jgi:hypothetical protein